MSQRIEILNHLKTKGSITPAQAQHKYGCWRLAPVILRLRKQGWPITTSLVYPKLCRSGYARYLMPWSLSWPKTS